MLKDLGLQPVYDSEYCDLIRDLQVPLLMHAKDYLRGVGFFTSGWLRLAAQGIISLASGEGLARIVLSPNLEEEDWNALKFGESAKKDDVLKEVLERNVDDLSLTLENDTRNALAWMVADGLLEFRFALPRDRASAGDYHDKVGIFADNNGDIVAIHGSLNDSVKASLNGEAFSVFKSWDPGQSPYVYMHKLRLETLWNNENKQFSVHGIPDAIREKFIKLRLSTIRPYSRPIILNREKTPSCPISLHDYQKDAIEAWRREGFRGVFEMATGTGKTITSLAAATSVYKEHERLALVILIPYLHLLEQWERNCREFGFDPILCSGEHDRWQINVKAAIQDYNIRTKTHICIIAVHNTGASEKFAKAARRLSKENTLLIGDEVHGLGSVHLRNALIETAGMRIGLSATPRRWFDEEGTKVIFDYFGNTCFVYTLNQAIGKFLTPYEYHPQLVSLTESELELYEEITQKVTFIYNSKDSIADKQDRIKLLLLKRARIVSSASQKIPVLVELLNRLSLEHQLKGESPKGILVYCSPGQHREVLAEISLLGLRCHEFVYDVSLLDREKLLHQFELGDIQVLVAIKCLDEGVDIPSTKTAFILASSTNPREFVQRRGRILRMSPGKERAVIYDFIVVPAMDRLAIRNPSDIAILKREMPRFVEFSESAINQYHARSLIRDILNKYEMLNLLDEKPWDVYHSLRQWDWSEDD